MHAVSTDGRRCARQRTHSRPNASVGFIVQVAGRKEGRKEGGDGTSEAVNWRDAAEGEMVGVDRVDEWWSDVVVVVAGYDNDNDIRSEIGSGFGFVRMMMVIFMRVCLRLIVEVSDMDGG